MTERSRVPHGPDGKVESLSEDLGELLVLARERDLSLGEIAEASHRRGLALLICVLAIPFAQPIPLPISPLLGGAIIILGFRLAVGQHVWLPGFILRRRIHRNLLQKVLTGSIAVARRIERLIRPRFNFMGWPGTRMIVGVHVIAAAVVLSLPIPGIIPFTNTAPAIAILLLGLGWMERDGLLVILGCVAAWGSWLYLALTANVLVAAFDRIHAWCSGSFAS
jgi:hypothetical protein